MATTEPATSLGTTHSDIAAVTAERARARRTRKIAYVVGMLVLLGPIVYLGMPAGSATDDAGGKIAQQRAEYGLGEGTLGDVDPASASMNLMLLGLRGMAANYLWMDAIKQKEHKDWHELEATTNSIIKLQPHFVQVWRFAGWNMAYNVSAEYDADEDRFYWVKKGTKFVTNGTNRNKKAAELYHERGDYLGKKIGRSDEWAQFRRYFLSDPDTERWGGGPDEELNPEGKDNYLVARDAYIDANRVAEDPDAIQQSKMAEPLFRGYPQRSLFDLAYARQRTGLFDEGTRQWWQEAYKSWTEEYGKERFRSRGYDIILNTDREEALTLAEEQGLTLEGPGGFYDIQDKLGKMVNYNYWSLRGEAESRPEMNEARQLMYDGKQLLFGSGESGEQDYEKSAEKLLRGLTLLERLIGAGGETNLAEQEADRREEADQRLESGEFSEAQRAQFLQEEDLIEDIIKSQTMYRYLLGLQGKDNDIESIPMAEVWKNNPQMVTEMNERFQAKVGSGSL